MFIGLSQQSFEHLESASLEQASLGKVRLISPIRSCKNIASHDAILGAKLLWPALEKVKAAAGAEANAYFSNFRENSKGRQLNDEGRALAKSIGVSLLKRRIDAVRLARFGFAPAVVRLARRQPDIPSLGNSESRSLYRDLDSQ